MSSKSELWDIKFVKIDILKEKISWYADRGYRSIGFLGWDISIHPNILELVDFCKTKWFQSINLISNGMKFDNFEFAQKIVELWATRMNFSIHSHLDSVEDYLIQVPGWLKRKLQAVDNFQLLYQQWKLKDALSINIVLNSKNYTTIVETVLFYYVKKWINDIRINFIWLNDDVRENWDDMKVTYTDFLPYLKKLIFISLKYNIRITFDTVPACIFYKIDKINYRKLVKKFLWEDQDHIVEIDHINNNDNFDWKQRKKDILKSQFSQCWKCLYKASCQWVRNWYVELYGDNEFQPVISDQDHQIPDERPQASFISSKEQIEFNPEKLWKIIEEGSVDEAMWILKKLYDTSNVNEQMVSMYALCLSKKWEYRKSIEILEELLQDIKNINDPWNIYFNLAVNYVHLENQKVASEYLEKSKTYIGDQENFKEFYNNFYNNIKKYHIDEFKDEILSYYTQKNQDNIRKLYVELDTNISSIINNK